MHRGQSRENVNVLDQGCFDSTLIAQSSFNLDFQQILINFYLYFVNFFYNHFNDETISSTF